MPGAFGASPAVVWAIKHVVAPVHRWVYRLTGGRIFGFGLNRDILLLTTTGRKTGRSHTTPVFFVRDSDRVVVCNVRPGSERANPRVLNLRANPTATVQIGSVVRTCEARELRDAELDRYWPQLVTLWPAYREHYERSGERTLFMLEPRSEA